MRSCLLFVLALWIVLSTSEHVARAQLTATIHSCRHPDNGVEETYPVSVFVACVPKANQCAQIAAQSFKAPPNIRFIKGYADPFVRPWDSSGAARHRLAQQSQRKRRFEDGTYERSECDDRWRGTCRHGCRIAIAGVRM